MYIPQNQIAPEATGGPGEGGGLSHWQGNCLLETRRLVHVSHMDTKTHQTVGIPTVDACRRLIPVRKDIEVVGGKMTKHAEECGQHLQAQNTVCYKYLMIARQCLGGSIWDHPFNFC